ncbi:MAG: hypothetical protein FWG27_00825 [Treponema sp.]|nr:hypothetical protein [Treponema sp.]
MAKNKAVYAPGELSKTRDRLKIEHLDVEEAKRMTQLLGGEIGYERTDEQESAMRKPKRVRNETVEINIGNRRRSRRIDIVGSDEEESISLKEYRKRKKKENDPTDDPLVPVKANYWERVKIDKYCGQVEFGIKSSSQVLVSMLSILSDPPDNVSPVFVNKRMNDCYKRIEILVTSVRTLFPRNNLKRNERLKKASPFAFSILDTIRYWNIDQISTNLSRIQTRPRNAKVSDFSEILREIYKPLYILEQLDMETHIKGAFKLLYKVLFLEDPTEAKGKYQELIRTALLSYGVIYRDVRYQLYPLLMKLLSGSLVPYEFFFQERKNRIKAFLQLSEKNRISPQMENAITEAEVAEIGEKTEEAEKAEEHPETKEVFDESNMDEPLTEEERIKQQAQESKAKTLERGIAVLETLFPKAGWDRIIMFPDLYSYFSDVFHLKKGVELIAPTDPLQQVYILCRILEEFFFGLRYTSFGTIIGSDGSPEQLNDSMNRIINNWQSFTESSFEKEYLPRLTEYCQLLENTAESRTSNYAKRLLNELHWTKRLFFFPYYKFESIMPPPFQKNATNSLYPELRSLKRYLSSVAAGIEQGNKRGGADQRAPCDGIENPWDPYVFQVPNPVSKRLDMLLAPKKRNNASLVYFTLAITVVLDYLLNDEDSWAYNSRTGFLFRSENGEGIRPLFGVDGKIDTEQLFKTALKKRQSVSGEG